MHLVCIEEVTNTMVVKSYSELILLPTFEERLEYLKLDGVVGRETFGYARYLNQRLYHDPRWLRRKSEAIVRDNGCDLGVDGYTIYGPILVHHINPITIDDILMQRACVFDLDNLITTWLRTHNAIHYGIVDDVVDKVVERKPNDTCPWRH